MKRMMLVALAVALLCLSAAASAAQAWVSVSLVLRAGPDPGYPRVMLIPAGSYVAVEGCLDDWSWCDVAVDGQRGWVLATYLQYDWYGRPVYLTDYGMRIGVPVVTFVFSNYWGNYYRYRPWYRERERWRHYEPRYRPVRRSLPPARFPHDRRPPVRTIRDHDRTVPSRSRTQPQQQIHREREREREHVRAQPARTVPATARPTSRPAPVQPTQRAAVPRSDTRRAPPARGKAPATEQRKKDRNRERRKDSGGGAA